MELQKNDSKKLFKVFDASKVDKRARKKRLGIDDTNSIATDDSNACTANVSRIVPDKSSLQNVPDAGVGHLNTDIARDRGSSPSVHREEHRTQNRSPRRHRRLPHDGVSLALKSGMVSTPRSISPPTGGDAATEAPTQDHDSFIYCLLEEAIKRDKKKHRHGRRHEDRRESRERDGSEARDHRHRHRRRRGDDARDRDKSEQRNNATDFGYRQEESSSPAVDQTVILETFAKICAQMNENCAIAKNSNNANLQRTQSHKSLQCEVSSRRDMSSCERRPDRSCDPTPDDNTPTRIRSQANCRLPRANKPDPDLCPYRYDEPKLDYEKNKYARIDYEPKYSKINVNHSRAVVNRMQEDDRYRGYHPPDNVATKTYLGSYKDRHRDRDYREYERRQYEDDRRRYIEQKTSRSFEVHRDGYEEERNRRTFRSDTKDKRYDDKYYEKPADGHKHYPKDRSRRPVDRYDRNSVASREEEYRERDRYSERERDSGLSVADGETSTISGRTGRSHYMRAVKQEIAEQREAMDKMMKLWKELMRCFKGISQSQDKDKVINESACENVRESAAAQLRLWRECMRRYETVARDVGDTDARLMEEISKQRSEMSEMASMWQECLQRYRDMSNDFNSLKQQLASAESPTRQAAAPAAAAPLVCAEGEGPPPAHYRLPHHYSQVMSGGPPAGYGGAALRTRASAPPAWWWGAEQPAAPRRQHSRRSSPDSRDGRDGRDTDRRTHRNKDSRDARYKEKSSKPSAARSEHRRRKR